MNSFLQHEKFRIVFGRGVGGGGGLRRGDDQVQEE